MILFVNGEGGWEVKGLVNYIPCLDNVIMPVVSLMYLPCLTPDDFTHQSGKWVGVN